MTSSVDKGVREFDLRIPVSLVTDHQEHSRPVMALTCSENYVYSGGEDKTLCVWDRRSQSVLQTLRVCGHVAMQGRLCVSFTAWCSYSQSTLFL